jgi:hypothetical protein
MLPSSGGGREAPADAADRTLLSSWTSYFEFRVVGPTAPVTEYCSLHRTRRTGAFPPFHLKTKSDPTFETCCLVLRRDGQIPETT